jgi:cytochrome c oxidase subunit IV
MRSVSQSQTITRIGPLQVGIIALDVATAFNHLSLSLAKGLPVGLIPMLWLLNCLGYLFLLACLYMPQLFQIQRIVRWALIGYTALTIVVWAVITHGEPFLLAYIDKVIEVALIVLLFVEDRQAQHRVM